MGIYLVMDMNEEEIHAGFKCLQIGDLTPRKPKSYVGRFFQNFTLNLVIIRRNLRKTRSSLYFVPMNFKWSFL